MCIAVYEAGLSVDDIWAVLPRGTSLERVSGSSSIYIYIYIVVVVVVVAVAVPSHL